MMHGNCYKALPCFLCKDIFDEDGLENNIEHPEIDMFPSPDTTPKHMQAFLLRQP